MGSPSGGGSCCWEAIRFERVARTGVGSKVSGKGCDNEAAGTYGVGTLGRGYRMSMEKQEEDVEPCEKGQEVFWTWWHALVVSLPPGGMLGDWRDQSRAGPGLQREQALAEPGLQRRVRGKRSGGRKVELITGAHGQNLGRSLTLGPKPRDMNESVPREK